MAPWVWSCAALLGAAAGAGGQVPAVCGDASGAAGAPLPTPLRGGGAVALASDGRADFGAPKLCSSYACRAAMLGQQQSLPSSTALSEQLLACALPKRPGSYELMDFVVDGLRPDTEDEWWPWVQQAFKDLRLCSACIQKATWFPKHGGVQFYVSSGPGLNASGFLNALSLGQTLNQQANPVWAVPKVGAGSGVLSVPTLRLTATVVHAPTGEAARASLAWFHAAAVFLVVYVLLALLAHHFGPRWLPPLVLCWPELCHGGGCMVYRVLFMPFVLVYNALRIYTWSCCMSYMAWCGHAPPCKHCLWHEFTDPDFPPNDHSVGNVQGDTASGIKNKRGVAWAKASVIANEDGHAPHLFQGRIEPADVLQGALGNCWLMAGLACVAERPDVLEQAIVTKHVDPRGKYHFRLWNQIKGHAGTKWVDVIVDENIPVEPGSLQPKFARPHDNEMWVLLIEKAFAKMYGGYDRLDGGQMSWALTALTGNPSLTLQKKVPGKTWTHGQDTESDDTLFRLLLKMRRNGAFVCCAMIAPSNKMGLIDGHAYSIIQLQMVRRSAVDTSYFRMVQIRNPHGQGEWLGAWSDKSKSWADFPYVRQSLVGDDVQVEDGTFWMQWEDFVQYWKEIQVVDCGVNIRTVAPPNYNETLGGPILSCLQGCWEYWCCCLGFRRLYFGRKPAFDLKSMEEGMDAQVGFDQEGFFCNYLQRTTTATDKFKGDAPQGGPPHGDHEHDDHDEHELGSHEEIEAGESTPLCCYHHHTDHAPVAGFVKASGRSLSRTDNGMHRR